jgi:PAT family beta-lactamase induction signal transducer AmpG
MALLMALGVVFILTQHEPFRLDEENTIEGTRTHQMALWIKKTVLEPFGNFMQHEQWALLLIFALLYRASDAMLGFMAMPFYKAMGFTAGEIASAVKVFGMIATLFGAFLGGALATRYGNMRMLLIGALMQALSNSVYIWIYMSGHDVSVLYGALFIENVTGGIAGTAFVAYLCQLCSVRFAATQYALLAALAGTPRIFLAAPSGLLIDTAGWVPYFSTTILVGVPAIALSWYLLQREKAGGMR